MQSKNNHIYRTLLISFIYIYIYNGKYVYIMNKIFFFLYIILKFFIKNKKKLIILTQQKSWLQIVNKLGSSILLFLFYFSKISL